MDFDGATFSETCICGKSFSQPGTYTHHKRICVKTKKRLAEALGKAKESWTIRKKRRLGTSSKSMVCVPMPVMIYSLLTISLCMVAGKPIRRSRYPSPAASTDHCRRRAYPHILVTITHILMLHSCLLTSRPLRERGG